MIYLLSFIGVQIVVGLEFFLHPRLEYNFKYSFLTASVLFALLFIISNLLIL